MNFFSESEKITLRSLFEHVVVVLPSNMKVEFFERFPNIGDFNECCAANKEENWLELYNKVNRYVLNIQTIEDIDDVHRLSIFDFMLPIYSRIIRENSIPILESCIISLFDGDVGKIRQKAATYVQEISELKIALVEAENRNFVIENQLREHSEQISELIATNRSLGELLRKSTFPEDNSLFGATLLGTILAALQKFGKFAKRKGILDKVESSSASSRKLFGAIRAYADDAGNQELLKQSNLELSKLPSSEDLEKANLQIEKSQTELPGSSSNFDDLSSRFDELQAEQKAKSVFLANMSHELRAPLNAILGFSDIIKTGIMESDPQKIKEYASDIHESGTYLLEIIDDIMDMSNLVEGQRSLKEEEFPIWKILKQVKSITTSRAQESNISLEFVLDRQLIIVADKRALKQIILNLVINSINFGKEGGYVRIKVFDKDSGVHIIVMDNGRGIQQVDLERIFQPFELVHDQYYKNMTGSGLGLPIASNLVKLHGGNIKIDTEAGEYTIVEFVIPQ